MANDTDRRVRARVRRAQRGATRPALIIIVVVLLAAALAIGWAAGRGAAPSGAAQTTVETGQEAHEDVAVRDAGGKILYWTCSMHPQIRAAGPGKCPICSMDLVPVRETGAGSAGDTLTLSERERRLAEVETSAVERRLLETKVRMVGRIDYAETNLAQVAARTSGRIDDLFVNYTGARVERGDKLVSIYSPELRTAQEEYLIALKSADAAKQSGGESEAGGATRIVEATRKKLELWGMPAEQIAELEKAGKVDDHTIIYAPISGTVTSRDVTRGQYVEGGQPILTISDLSTVWALLEAHESDVARLAPGQPVTFEADALPGEELKGQVEFINSYVAEATRTVKVRASVANPGEKLKPGMYVSAVVATAAVHDDSAEAAAATRYACPMKCEGDKTYDKPGACPVCNMTLQEVAPSGAAPQGMETARRAGRRGARQRHAQDRLRREGAGRVRGARRAVGPRSGEYFPVLSGLSEGERVVTRGGFLIDSQFQIMGRGACSTRAGCGAEARPAQWSTAPQPASRRCRPCRA